MMESYFGLSLRSNKEGQKLHVSSQGKTSPNSNMLGHLSQGASEPKASLVFTGKVTSCPLHSSLLLEEGQTSRPLSPGTSLPSVFCHLFGTKWFHGGSFQSMLWRLWHV